MPIELWRREEKAWLDNVWSQDFRTTLRNPYVATENLGE